MDYALYSKNLSTKLELIKHFFYKLNHNAQYIKLIPLKIKPQVKKLKKTELFIVLDENFQTISMLKDKESKDKTNLKQYKMQKKV